LRAAEQGRRRCVWVDRGDLLVEELDLAQRARERLGLLDRQLER
jgi:hypothetical protein